MEQTVLSGSDPSCLFLPLVEAIGGGLHTIVMTANID